ncbi:MAG TPA: hypothetical protein VGN18_06685 [Jatrophihabitans sp.]|uniref:hypothetical protein n=1 Tax=Jatrophihabitans sp. TaxID=1932789 RepID=UPI002DFE16EC|nr:hypothetical protein [Jatrophihabitans sp.]
MTVHRAFDAGTDTPAAARRFGCAAVIAALRPSGWDVADDAEIVISELVTDAVRAGAHHVELLVDLHHSRLEISVTDDRAPDTSPGPLETSTPSSQIMAALTTHRGARTGDDGRTISWAELECDPLATTLVDCTETAGSRR